MKLALLIATALAGCAPTQSPIPASTILDSAAEYNGRRVRVCGLLADGLESCRLSTGYGQPVPDYPNLRTIPPSMWINGPNGTCVPGNPSPMAGDPFGGWAVVEGTFETGGRFGHLGFAEHQLNATKIELVKEPCVGSRGEA